MATAIVRAPVAADYPRNYPRIAQELPKKYRKACGRVSLTRALNRTVKFSLSVASDYPAVAEKLSFLMIINNSALSVYVLKR